MNPGSCVVICGLPKPNETSSKLKAAYSVYVSCHISSVRHTKASSNDKVTYHCKQHYCIIPSIVAHEDGTHI